MVQRTFYALPHETPDTDAWEPAPDDVHTLRHGYNLADLSRLARMATSTVRVAGFSYGTGYEVAWSAIAECLYASPEPPQPTDLVHAGWNAIRRHVMIEMHHHGKDVNSHRYGQPMPRFAAYWELGAGRTGGVERTVVERTALYQIWPRLLPSHREALGALATLGDYEAAAAATGRKPSTFRALIADARRMFLELWHEGEEPSRPWGLDRRSKSPTGRPAGRRATRAMERRRERGYVKPKREVVHGKASTYSKYRCRCRPCTDAKTAQQSRYRAAKAAS